MGEIVIRDWEPADIAALYAINEAAVPGVGSVTAPAFERLVAVDGAATLVADDGVAVLGFVLGMFEGRDYASLNYAWLSQRYAQFAYIDRVAVRAGMRGRGTGEALYRALVSRFTGVREVLLAEVNLAPPNPGSLRFHKRLGFREVGERWEIEGEKGVVYLERTL